MYAACVVCFRFHNKTGEVEGYEPQSESKSLQVYFLITYLLDRGWDT